MHRLIIRYVTITVFDIKGAKKGEISIFFYFFILSNFNAAQWSC